MLYNIQNNNDPMYLCDLIPPTIQSTTVYPLRNGSGIIIPFCRLYRLLVTHLFPQQYVNGIA